MNGQIFYLTNQEAIARKIAALLRKHIFEEMRVDTLEFSDHYNKFSGQKEHERFRDFVSLFKASMIRVDDFAIVVLDGGGRWLYAGGGPIVRSVTLMCWRCFTPP